FFIIYFLRSLGGVAQLLFSVLTAKIEVTLVLESIWGNRKVLMIFLERFCQAFFKRPQKALRCFLFQKTSQEKR
ncbi:hypothetical protein V4762_09735, partial [Thermodesulfobium sp. 4217-1]|uniref:hypothetical protein n=1 Tax=Thermodesulfobium sp. 4217-1 TaxID=3120013 RepID=UPI003221C4EE